jgi:GAF domain-containing protein
MASRLTSVLADPERLAAVRQTGLLDTPAEDAFDRVARMAARLLEVPIALVPLIEDDRQFFKACVGLPEPWASARQTPLSHSLCQHVMVARQPLAIGDTGRDALARDNPLVRELGLAAYLGVPLIDTSGHVLGSLCVADRRPRDWTPEQVVILTDLAGLVMTQIQLRAELATRGELERRLIDVEASLQALLERLPGVVYALQLFASASRVLVGNGAS